MATTTLRAGMVWRGEYDSSVTYDKLDVVYNADKTQIAVCKQGGSGIPLTNSNYWEVSIDASGIIALLEDALSHGEIYTMKIGSVTTGATSSATIVNNHQTHETILNLVLEKGEKGDKGDKGDRGEKGDTTVIDPSTATAYTLYNQTGNHTDGAMTQEAVTEEFEKLDEAYARNDGYYESMGVGMATNLKGQNTVDAEFAYRKSGGNVEVQDGNAMIEAIKGNTIAWNQMIKETITNIYYTFNNGSNIVISDTPTTFNGYDFNVCDFKTIVGHKYYEKITSNVDTGYFFLKNYYSVASPFNTVTSNSGGVIVTETASWILCLGYSNVANGTYKIDVRLIDLTLIYGEGNEPSTPEQFEQDYFNWFGKPLTYEPYDAGSLRNTKVSALKTTGFNQWDEEWENCYFDSAGKKVISNTNVGNKGQISVYPNTAYYIAGGVTNPTLFYGMIVEYDASGSVVQVNANPKRLFTTSVNTRYIAFNVASAYGNTYNNDICINLSDPNRNGEYEPYKVSTLPLDVTTLTGKLNGEGSSVVVFANGMNSAGNVHDEIKIENGVVKAIKRVGSVDLGTLGDWYITTGESSVFRCSVNGRKGGSIYLVCPIYYDIGIVGNVRDLDNMQIGTHGSSDVIFIKNTSYTDATTFRAAMNGVMLYYELAEPEVYVLDDFNLPKLYPVANGGTEEQLSNSPNSLPATLSIRYGLNAAAFIQNAPKNYISKESMSNFLSNLGSAMGGAWSMTWNSSTNKYDFSFTQNRSVDVKQPIEDK